MQIEKFYPKSIHLNDVDSTNNYIANLVRTHQILHGTVVSADYQHEGKGQRATKWQSLVAQNGLFSIYLQWNQFKINDQFQLSMLVALSIVACLNSESVQNVSIKWPNDIYVRDKKIAGILIENDLCSDSISSSIVGIGININQVEFALDLNATSMKLETGRSFDIQYVIQKIGLLINELLQEFTNQPDPHPNIKDLYLKKLLGFNQIISVFENQSKLNINITPIDISRSGHLLALNENKELMKYDVKEFIWTPKL